MAVPGPEAPKPVATNFSLKEAVWGRDSYYQAGPFQYPGREVIVTLYHHPQGRDFTLAVGHTLNRSSGFFSSPTEYIPDPPRWLVSEDCHLGNHHYVEACHFYGGGKCTVHLCLNCLASKSTTRQ